MKKEYWTLPGLCICLCLLLISSGCDIQPGGWKQAKFERTVQRQAPLASGSTVIAETSFGSVTVTGGDVADCRVVAEICGRAPTKQEAQELAEQVTIELEMVGDILTVKADKPRTQGNRSISISYEIIVPRETNVKCASSYGAITLADINGSASGKTSSGSIKAENIKGTIDLHTSYILSYRDRVAALRLSALCSLSLWCR